MSKGETTQVLTIKSVEYYSTSRSGNPRWRLTFTDGRKALTEADVQVGYGIENSEYRNGPVVVTFDPAGHIIGLRVADA